MMQKQNGEYIYILKRSNPIEGVNMKQILKKIIQLIFLKTDREETMLPFDEPVATIKKTGEIW